MNVQEPEAQVRRPRDVEIAPGDPRPSLSEANPAMDMTCLPKDGAELSKNHQMSSCFSLVWFYCFAAHLIGHVFSYITVLVLYFIFEFFKHCNRQRYQTMVPLRGKCNDLKNVQY